MNTNSYLNLHSFFCYLKFQQIAIDVFEKKVFSCIKHSHLFIIKILVEVAIFCMALNSPLLLYGFAKCTYLHFLNGPTKFDKKVYDNLGYTDTLVWIGKNTDWNNALNWSPISIPTSSKSVKISAGLQNYPVVTNNAFVNNLMIDDGCKLLITLNGRLYISGNINCYNGIDARVGTVVLNGSLSQEIIANQFSDKLLAHLELDNQLPNATEEEPNVTISKTGGSLLIVKSVKFGNVNNAILKTNSNLTILSFDAKSAMISDLTNDNLNYGNKIIGKLTIERFINEKRAWRLLTAPIAKDEVLRISDSWQESAVSVSNPSVINAINNPLPGYGTHITYGNPAINGFDQGVNGNTSIRFLTTTGWDGVPIATNDGTGFNSGNITDQPGYFLFIRGNRGTVLSQGTNATPSATRLRVNGNINTGLLNVELHEGYISGNSQFRVVGNPYSSTINYHKMMLNSQNIQNGFSDAFYLWNPYVTGSNAVGGWIAFSYNSMSKNYDQSIGANDENLMNSTGDIQSGTAFVIDYSGTNFLQFKESDKSIESNSIQLVPVNSFLKLRVNLLAKNNDQTISVNDGALVIFDSIFDNSVSNHGMKKMMNFSENLSIKNQTELLCIHKRKALKPIDSVFICLTNLKQKKYQLKIEWETIVKMNETIVFVVDKYLNKKIELNLNGSTVIDFTVSVDSLSFNPDRFQLLFRPKTSFTKFELIPNNVGNYLSWDVTGAEHFNKFSIERSFKNYLPKFDI